jgi:hypothetical protein
MNEQMQCVRVHRSSEVPQGTREWYRGIRIAVQSLITTVRRRSSVTRSESRRQKAGYQHALALADISCQNQDTLL